MIKIKLIVLSMLAMGCLASGESLSEGGFDAKYINEKSHLWPFDNAGKVLNVDTVGKKFDFLKNTVYDKEILNKVIGRAWNVVHWTKDTTFIQKDMVHDFSKLEGEVIVKFFVGNADEVEKMSKGVAFISNKATVYASAKTVEGIEVGEQEVVGLFKADGLQSGIIMMGDKPVQVKTSWKLPRITIFKDVHAGVLKGGHWSARIGGKSVGDRFIATGIELTSIASPTENDDPKLPRLLVIGDSISMNYGKAAKEALRGVVNYHRNEGNSYSSNYGAQYVKYWLGDYKKKGQQWDVIHFNHGLHDLKQSGPDVPYAMSLENYKMYLHLIIKELQKSGAKLIWTSTTPVPNDKGGPHGRQKGAELAFNRAAKEVISKYPDIMINDLCGVVHGSEVFDNFRKGSDVHYYNADERKVLGDAVAEVVKKALQVKK